MPPLNDGNTTNPRFLAGVDRMVAEQPGIAVKAAANPSPFKNSLLVVPKRLKPSRGIARSVYPTEVWACTNSGAAKECSGTRAWEPLSNVANQLSPVME